MSDEQCASRSSKPMVAPRRAGRCLFARGETMKPTAGPTDPPVRSPAWEHERRCMSAVTRGRRGLATRGGVRTLVAVVAGALLPALLLASTTGCDRDSENDGGGRPRVTMYVSADDAVGRDVLRACTEATGVEVVPVFDTEATKSAGLERRVIDEALRPRADLFWSSEGFAPVRLAALDLLDRLPDDVVAAWPARHVDPAGRWIAFAARARVVVARQGTPPPPGAWSGFAEPGLARGSRAAVAIADPRFGTTRGHLAALAESWGGRTSGVDGSSISVLEPWLAGLRANGVLVLPGGNAATVDAVRAGEVAYGFTDSDDALAAIARGAPLAMWLPRTHPEGVSGGGTMIVPNTLAVVRGGPADRAVVDRVVRWFASGAPEEILCRSASRNLPLVVATDCDPGFAEPDPLEFGLIAAASDADRLAVEAKRLLEGRGEPRSNVGSRSP